MKLSKRRAASAEGIVEEADASKRRKSVLGLVGGIGSGKSQVAAELAKRGGYLIAGDPLGHEALEQPSVRDQVQKNWGKGVLSDEGTVNRRALGRIVFADPEQRESLESIVYPYIEKRIKEEQEKAEQQEDVPFIVFDAAVMLETGWSSFCDQIIFVHTPRQIRVARLREKRGMSDDEIVAREQSQWPLIDKMRRADFVVNNCNSPESLTPRVDELLALLGSEGKLTNDDVSFGRSKSTMLPTMGD